MSENKNDGNPEDLLPDWMRNVFQNGNRLCTNCEGDLRLDHLNTVEVYCPRFNGEIDFRPRLGLEAICHRCEFSIRITVKRDLTDLLHGVESFYQYAEQKKAQQGDLSRPHAPSKTPEIPLDDNAEQADGVDVERTAWDMASRLDGYFDGDNNESPIEARFRKRRRRRYEDLSKPISEPEVEGFVTRVNRTSFKRSTKSFREFMRRLGIDIDKDYDTEGGDQ